MERSELVSKAKRLRSKNSYDSGLGVPKKTAMQAVIVDLDIRVGSDRTGTRLVLTDETSVL